MTATLTEYQRHLEKFGSECLLKTAAHDLGTQELAQLKALVDSMERSQRFHRGRWIDKGQEVRQCLTCSLDLPRGASSQMRRHAQCKNTAYRASRAASRPGSPAEAQKLAARAH